MSYDKISLAAKGIEHACVCQIRAIKENLASSSGQHLGESMVLGFGIILRIFERLRAFRF